MHSKWHKALRVYILGTKLLEDHLLSVEKVVAEAVVDSQQLEVGGGDGDEQSPAGHGQINGKERGSPRN